MATREEVMTTAERHIRRGELDVAVGLLERWLAVFPDDGPARTRLAAVRALADEERPHARPAFAPPSRAERPPAHAPAVAPPDDLAAVRSRRLRALLDTIKANRRTQ